MPLLYTCVACKSVVLADYADVVGNFESATVQILDRTDPSKFSRHTYSLKKYNYHVLTKDGFTFLVIADQDFPKRISFGFLEKVEEIFSAGDLVLRATTAKPYELRRDFSPVLERYLNKYNNPAEVDSMAHLHQEVDDVKDVMNQNIERIIQRGKNLDTLHRETEELGFNARQFKRSGVELHRKMWWKNVKVMVVLSVTLILIITIVTLVILWQNNKL